MKPLVHTHLGASEDGSHYSVAIFVVELASRRDAEALQPLLKDAAEAALKDYLRRGLHAVDPSKQDHPARHQDL